MRILLAKCPHDRTALCAAAHSLFYTAHLPPQDFDYLVLVGKSERIYQPVFGAFGGADVHLFATVSEIFNTPQKDWDYEWTLTQEKVFNPPLNLLDFINPALSAPEKKMLLQKLHRFESFMEIENGELLLPLPEEQGTVRLCRPMPKEKSASSAAKRSVAGTSLGSSGTLGSFGLSSSLSSFAVPVQKDPTPLDIRAIKKVGDTVSVKLTGSAELYEGEVTAIDPRTEESHSHPGVMVLTDQVVTVHIPDIGDKKFTASGLFRLSHVKKAASTALPHTVLPTVGE